MPLLETQGLTKYFGGLAAVQELNLEVNQGEIVGLIGPNGAGKTTAFNMIAGFSPPTRGKILFEGEDITGLKPYRIIERGIARTFQLTTLFGNLSVLLNVLIACQHQVPIGFWEDLFHTGSARGKEQQMVGKVFEVLQFIGLANLMNELAKNLSHGYQRLLAIAIALATSPKLLLLDEPFTGMNPQEVATLLGCLESIRHRGTTILLIEHNMAAVMECCDRLAVLNYGQKIAEGPPGDIVENEEVIRAYLGPKELI